MTAPRIAFAAGGTAGHIFPAVAVAEALAGHDPSFAPLFIGSSAGLERELLPRLGYDLRLIRALPFQCRGIASRLRALASIPPSIADARQLLTRERIDAVIGFGGYASIGPITAASLLGLPTAIIDGNERLGLANRLLARFAERLYVAPWTAVTSRATVVRNAIPVRAAVAAAAAHAVGPPKEGHATILVLGDRFLDARVPALLRTLADSGLALHVIHRSPEAGRGSLAAAYGSAIEVELHHTIHDIAAAYGRAHLVIGRGGANTLAEVAITGRPALIVPLRAAAENHQTSNARRYASTGAAVVASESEWNPAAIAASVVPLLRDTESWLQMSRAARSSGSPTSAAAIADDFLSFLSGTPRRELSAARVASAA